MVESLSLAPSFRVYLGTHCRSILLNVVWTCWCYLPPQFPMADQEIHHPLHKEIFYFKICFNLIAYCFPCTLLTLALCGVQQLCHHLIYCLYDSANLTCASIRPYLFGNLKGLAGLEGGEKQSNWKFIKYTCTCQFV